MTRRSGPAHADLARLDACCRLCGATAGQARIMREPLARIGQWLYSCADCSGLYLAPDFTEQGEERFQKTGYRRLYPFEYCSRPNEAYLHGTRTREIGLRRAQALSAHLPEGARVLELGSGHGGFLGALHRLRPDLTLCAVEPDRNVRRLALDGAAVDFLDVGLPPASRFDLIALFHVLEHLRDPGGQLAQCAEHLSPGGRVVIEVPGVDPTDIARRDIHVAHLSYFTAASLERLLTASGLVRVPSNAAGAMLPGCLWVEAARAVEPLSLPGDTPPPVTPHPPRHLTGLLRRAVRTMLGLALSARIARWRAGPELDDGLSVAGGRQVRVGIGLDPVTSVQLLEEADQAMAARTGFRIADVNVAKFIGMLHDPDFRMAVATAQRVVSDGQGLIWGLRLLGLRLPERIAGADLMARIVALCSAKGYRPFLLGAREAVVRRTAEVLQERYPDLRLAGFRDGYFSETDYAEVVRQVDGSGADCVIVALPSPRQDKFLAQLQRDCTIPLVMGVGGSFDVVAGRLKRAPRWVQRAGMEWMFRLLQEPGRLLWRYLDTNAKFLLILIIHGLARSAFRARAGQRALNNGGNGPHQD